MHTRYNQQRVRALSDKGKKMARARWALDQARRDAEEPERLRELAEIHAINLPRAQGDVLGSLQCTESDTGRVRRWVVRIGDRADRITMETAGGKPTRSHGWTWALTKLRPYLAGAKL